MTTSTCIFYLSILTTISILNFHSSSVHCCKILPYDLVFTLNFVSKLRIDCKKLSLCQYITMIYKKYIRSNLCGLIDCIQL